MAYYFYGTNASESIYGTSSHDVIYGYGGNELFMGRQRQRPHLWRFRQ